MVQKLETPTTTTTRATSTTQDPKSCAQIQEPTTMFSDEFEIDSTCSTPYVSAPSSPGRGAAPISGFYYSAPASPMHFMLSSTASSCCISKNSTIEASPASSTCSFEFDFSARLATANGGAAASAGSMSSADELFLNGQIRPMKLSSHLQRPQVLAPLIDLDDDPDDDDSFVVNDKAQLDRGRDSKIRDRSLRRRTRSMSPLRTISFEWQEDYEANGGKENDEKKNKHNEKEEEEEEVVSSETTTPCESGASSRSSSVGRSSKRWVFLKEFLYRSKSEGRNNGHKFWGSLSFSPVKDKIKMEKFMASKIPSTPAKEKNTASSSSETPTSSEATAASEGKKAKQNVKELKKKAVNGVGKRRVPPSPHELHYTTNRAQAEEMRKKTFLPYRQGLLGCLGFSSKSYGAMNGFARALNPVSSR